MNAKNQDIPVVILAGGLGTRLAEETSVRPKPMVEIGGIPIAVHIMDWYSKFGFKNFIFATGYMSSYIKEYFVNFHLNDSDIDIDLGTGKVEILDRRTVDWHVKVIDTGLATNTGGRLLRLKKYLSHSDFMITYGDGVANVDLNLLSKVHVETKAVATITSVRPPARFGAIKFDGHLIKSFHEKPNSSEGWINGGFMRSTPELFDYINDDSTILEHDIFPILAQEDKLATYKHGDFWHPMDTLRDKNLLEKMWQDGEMNWTRSSQ
jgi:glucose-1-phosphate cytidylyltransferase